MVVKGAAVRGGWRPHVVTLKGEGRPPPRGFHFVG